MKEYIMAIDQGTTSTRVIIFNQSMDVVEIAQKEIRSFYPEDGWVEQNPEEIWQSVLDCADQVLRKSGLTIKEIRSIGITNQRETTVVFDRNNHKPVYNAIVWQSRQSENVCQRLKDENHENTFKDKTGLLIDPYFSGTKVRWILDKIADSNMEVNQDDLLFGTIDTWILYNLTGGKVHATDCTNASRTLLYNIYDLCWDEQLLEILDIPLNMMPEVKDSGASYGTTAKDVFFNGEIPITAIMGDQQASLFGHGCFQAGMAKNTYGTGCFMLMNTGTKPVKSTNGLITTIAWSIDGEVNYALEGSVFVAGNAIKWLKQGLELFDSPAITNLWASELESNENVYFVPAFVGLGAPYWNDKARGIIVGITQATTKKTLTRATLESLAYQNKDILDVMVAESGIAINSLKVDGKVTDNDFLMQFQADILKIVVNRARVAETTALGAAMMAGLQSGFFRDFEHMIQNLAPGKTFTPRMADELVVELYRGWQKAVRTCIYQTREMDD